MSWVGLCELITGSLTTPKRTGASTRLEDRKGGHGTGTKCGGFFAFSHPLSRWHSLGPQGDGAVWGSIVSSISLADLYFRDFECAT